MGMFGAKDGKYRNWRLESTGLPKIVSSWEMHQLSCIHVEEQYTRGLTFEKFAKVLKKVQNEVNYRKNAHRGNTIKIRFSKCKIMFILNHHYFYHNVIIVFYQSLEYLGSFYTSNAHK